MSDRQASALAAAITETEAIAPEIAKLRGIALASVFQIIITEAGRRTREGQNQEQIAGQLRPAIEAVLDDLDRVAHPCDELRACQSHSLRWWPPERTAHQARTALLPRRSAQPA